jgi:hypothetical protein
MDPAAGYAEQASASVADVMIDRILPEIQELHLVQNVSSSPIGKLLMENLHGSRSTGAECNIE